MLGSPSPSLLSNGDFPPRRERCARDCQVTVQNPCNGIARVPHKAAGSGGWPARLLDLGAGFPARGGSSWLDIAFCFLYIF